MNRCCYIIVLKICWHRNICLHCFFLLCFLYRIWYCFLWFCRWCTYKRDTCNQKRDCDNFFHFVVQCGGSLYPMHTLKNPYKKYDIFCKGFLFDVKEASIKGFKSSKPMVEGFEAAVFSISPSKQKIVEVGGLEPPTFWSQTRHAANCTTPRKNYIKQYPGRDSNPQA